MMTQTTQQFSSWVTTASPDDLMLIGKQVTSRIADLGLEYRKQFVSNLPDRIYDGLPDKAHV